MSRARPQKGEVLVGKISDVARQLPERHELVELFKVQTLDATPVYLGHQPEPGYGKVMIE